MHPGLAFSFNPWNSAHGYWSFEEKMIDMLESHPQRFMSAGLVSFKSGVMMPLSSRCLKWGYSNRTSFCPLKARSFSHDKCAHSQSDNIPRAIEKRKPNRLGKKEHHLWMKRDSAGSGQKALNLIRIVSELPNEREAVYGALDKWIAWETEFPLIAAAKALVILRKRSQWTRVIQVAKWMLNKGQGATMATYDTLLLAFDMEKRVDEAESLWNMILHTHTRSISKQLFSRMISLYDHHDMQDKLIEVFADMEELGIKPDEDTTRRISRAFKNMGQEDKQKLVLERYQCKWKYMHFNGERVKVKRNSHFG